MKLLDFVYNVLRTLRTSSIAAVVERLRPLLHLDPVAILQKEITSEIFSYLTPSMLLEASRASKAWRASCLDTRLWKQKFNLEGWELDMDEVRSFEQRYNSLRTSRSQRAKPHSDRPTQKKRSRAEVDIAEDSNHSRPSRSSPTEQSLFHKWNNQHYPQDVRDKSGHSKITQNDVEMYDADSNAVAAHPAGRWKEPQTSTNVNDSIYGGEEVDTSLLPIEMNHGSDNSSEAELQDRQNSSPHLMVKTSSGALRLNYHHVFKQKRKLEDNWNAGSYQSFQLPHRDHPEEAHSECVYTIQYIGNYLVSGSRDRSLRIWDLETQRLVGKPLIGHTASVLCLQFDNQENENSASAQRISIESQV